MANIPEKKSKAKFPSELRFNLVSKDWIVIATGRARRPETFKEEEERKDTEKSQKACPFCQVETQEKPTLIFVKGKKIAPEKGIPKDWTTIVIPNKFPAVLPGESLNERAEGPYQLMDGVGFHEIVVTRDHQKDIPQLKREEVKEVIDAYQERYLEFMNEKFVNYISIFHNHGAKAGASITHPHSQIMAIPVTDPDIENSLISSRRYWDIHQKCLHCEMLRWDKEDGRRVVFENEHFLALCPFASRMAFQIRIYPKTHLSYFERISEKQKLSLSEVLRVALQKLRKALRHPAYNFYLRTSPCDGKDHSHYHWHFEILPRTGIQAGFEFGAGIEISTIEPERAAEYLRKQ